MKDTTMRIRTQVINYKHRGCVALDTSALLASLMLIKDISEESHTKSNIDKLISMIVQCDLTS